MNEMRYPAEPTTRDGENILASWVDEMAGHLKRYNSNHLVTTGSEEFVTGENQTYGRFGEWMNREGYDFVDIHDTDNIDIATFHLYPSKWNLSDNLSKRFILDRIMERDFLLKKDGLETIQIGGQRNYP